jgi:hypothetical protein
VCPGNSAGECRPRPTHTSSFFSWVRDQKLRNKKNCVGRAVHRRLCDRSLPLWSTLVNESIPYKGFLNFHRVCQSVESSRYNVLLRAAGYPKSHSLPRGHTGITDKPTCYNFGERILMTNLDGIVQMLRKEHARLAKQMTAITAALSAFGSTYATNGTGRRKISAAGRARIAAAQKARWAKSRAGSKEANVVVSPKKRTLSPAARKRIAAAQRARWAKAKAGKKLASIRGRTE